MGKTRTETYSVRIEIDEATGLTIYEEWQDTETGKTHRPDGPARVEVQEVEEGVFHRITAYMRQGESHRDGDNPAVIVTDLSSGKDLVHEWWKYGQQHREEQLGPAHVVWDKQTRLVVYEFYMLNGVPHRSDGPAFTRRDPNTGQVIASSYKQNGVEVPSQGVDTPEHE